MKKKIMMILLAAMALSLLGGCGKKKTDEVNVPEPNELKTEAEEKQEPEEEMIPLDNGYWVADSMVMEGAEFSGSDMEGIFGPKDSIMSLAFSPDGTLKGILFEDFLSADYTGAIDDFTIQLPDETLKGSSPENGKIVLTLKDGSVIHLVNQKDMPDAIANNPWMTYEADFDTEETCAMSNFMMYGRYVIEDGILYGLTHSNGLSGALAATNFEMVGDFPEFGDIHVLDPNGTAVYLNKAEDYLYYIRDYQCVCRVKTDGSGLEVLYDGPSDYLQLHEGKLYFCDENYHFVSMDMDGQNLTTVVEKEIYYPYFIATDWMVFQDDADGESLHLYNTTHGEEVNITYEISDAPVLDGNYLYYIDRTEEGCYLSRIDMSDPQTFRCEQSEIALPYRDYMIDDVRVYTLNNNSIEKENWMKLENPDAGTRVTEMYVSKDYTIHHELDENEMISRKVLMSKEKSGGNAFY